MTSSHLNSNFQGTNPQRGIRFVTSSKAAPRCTSGCQVGFQLAWVASFSPYPTKTKSRWATSSRDDSQHLDQTLNAIDPEMPSFYMSSRQGLPTGRRNIACIHTGYLQVSAPFRSLEASGCQQMVAVNLQTQRGRQIEI